MWKGYEVQMWLRKAWINALLWASERNAMRGETLIKRQLEMPGSFQQISKEVGSPTVRSEKKDA